MITEPLTDSRQLKAMERDFTEWVYRVTEVPVKVNESLGVYAGPDISEETFAAMCEEAADEKSEGEIEKVTARYERKLDQIVKRLEREVRELREDRAELERRKQEETISHAETLISFLGKRRRSLSSSMSKRRMTQRAQEDVEESEEAIEDFEAEIRELEQEKEESLAKIQEKWQEIAHDVDAITVTPYKKDIFVDLFGVAWFPHHVIKSGGTTMEIPGFQGQ